ncbi:MAG TPA: HupE/UreJ family protein [Gammaproteobacteria bacterium]|nr:HupE/UreJ family protein [Gammaproteobacteria bacterium]
MRLLRRPRPLRNALRLFALAPLALLALLAAPAGAHRLSPAYFGLTESAPRRFEAQWKVSIPGGLADALVPKIPEGCAVEGQVRSYEVGDARIQHGTLDCPKGLAGRVLAIEGLAASSTDVLLRVDFADGTSFTHRLVPSAPSVVIPARAGPFEVVRTYLVLGVEHILLGVDHLLFVLALLLLVDGFRRLFATVTAFTLAHSITLAAATLGFVAVPSAPVEATIALSILFVATELARRPVVGRASVARSAASRSSPPSPPSTAGGEAAGRDLMARFPWIVAFSFGLLHGFGFAGALSEVGLPAHAIPLALFFFNVGVEIGQLLFIAAVVALGLGWRRLRLPEPAAWPRWAAYGIGSAAAYWVIERTQQVLL